MRELIIFGNGDLAELACYYFQHDSPLRPVAFTVDADYITDKVFCGMPVIPFAEIDQHFSPAHYEMFVALSYQHQNYLRQQKYDEAKEKGYQMARYICSKSAVWEPEKIGDNSFILECTIQPHAHVGNNVMIFSGAQIGHHVIIKDHCFLAGTSVVGGGSVIEENSFIGLNATLRDRITIGKECIIGAGSVILSDLAPYTATKAQSAKTLQLKRKVRKI